MALRIIAGAFKGRKLRSVAGNKTRPTANRTREAIFNIIASQVSGSRVLDLFAGTGAFGIEALSRKAKAAVFIDIDNDAIAALRANLQSLDLGRQSKIIRWDLTQRLNCLKPGSESFDLVFMDPPYRKDMIQPALQSLHLSHCLASDTRIIVEHSLRETVSADPLPFAVADQRRYGKTLVTFLDYMV